MATAEPMFGTMKQAMGFRQFLARGWNPYKPNGR